MSRSATLPPHRRAPDTLCPPAFRIAFPLLAAVSLALLLSITLAGAWFQ